MISRDMASILVIQLHLGTIVDHPTKPVFLYLPTAKRLLPHGKDKVIYRCYNTLYGGYITCSNPFGALYPNISYIQTYDPTFHMIRAQRKANITLYTIYGDYGSCSEYVSKKTVFMRNFFEAHNQRLEHIQLNLRLRVEFVANFDTYEDSINALKTDSLFKNLVKTHFLFVYDDDDSGGRITTLGTLDGNWESHVYRTEVTYLRDLIAAIKSWKRVPNRDTARRMYDAEIKFKYFNEGSTRLLDYTRLKLLVGGRSLIQEENDDDQDHDDDDQDHNNDGLIYYIINDNDYNHRLAITFEFTEIKIMYSKIPISWNSDYVKIYLKSADKYDIVTRPHTVFSSKRSRTYHIENTDQTQAHGRD
ncbi:hypothetical protein JTB14_023456 [Gonioctena quinquepunctata]|nr:hypothetical protein JTB14_023456 [Gonioctena quinquepunctata]